MKNQEQLALFSRKFENTVLLLAVLHCTVLTKMLMTSSQNFVMEKFTCNIRIACFSIFTLRRKLGDANDGGLADIIGVVAYVSTAPWTN